MKRVKKTPMVVGFDLDGVLIDHTENKIFLAAKWGWRLNPDETPSDIMKQKLSAKAYADIQQQLYGDIPLPKESPLMDGAVSAMEILERHSIPFVLISRRKNPHAVIALLEWHKIVPRYFSLDRMFFVDEPEDKNKKARVLGVTHFVDDEIRVLSVLSEVPFRFLFDPHSVFSSTDTYTRISSFHELIQALQI